MNALRSSVAAALVLLAVSMPGAAGAGAGAPAGHYVLSGTGAGTTIYDTKTNLAWLKSPRLGTWEQAKTMCAEMGATIGGTGWRLPTYKELLTLLDLSQTNTTSVDVKIDPLFGYAGDTGYWSATLDATDPRRAWNVNFFYGDTYPYTITNQNAFRCVRSGP